MFPRSIDDVIFSSISDKNIISRIVAGDVSFPSDAIRSILFYGRFGTGKTTTAMMMPTLIEYRLASMEEKEGNDWCYIGMGRNISITPSNEGKNQITPPNLLYMNCGEVNKATSGMFDALSKFIKSFLGNIAVASSHLHIVLDEVDCLDKEQQDKLKGFMTSTPYYVLFYLTTNHIDKVREGLQSRSHLVLMDGVNDNNKGFYIQTLKEEFDYLSKYTDEQLETWIEATAGDWREIEKGVIRL